MVHLHWPRWTSQIFDDVERQGELQIIGFVLSVAMLIGALLFGAFTVIVELFRRLS